jgi:hypothetical protein
MSTNIGIIRHSSIAENGMDIEPVKVHPEGECAYRLMENRISRFTR